MNSGPEHIESKTEVLPDGTERDVDTVRHWGVRLLGGTVRWCPGYGSGVYVPYSEQEARVEAYWEYGTVVSRTETTTVDTTPWQEA